MAKDDEASWPVIECQVPEYFYSHVAQFRRIGSCLRMTLCAETTTIDGQKALEPVVKLVIPWEFFLGTRVDVAQWIEREHMGDRARAGAPH